MKMHLLTGVPLAEYLLMGPEELKLWIEYDSQYGIYDPVWSMGYLVSSIRNASGNYKKQFTIEDCMPVRKQIKPVEVSANVKKLNWQMWAMQLGGK